MSAFEKRSLADALVSENGVGEESLCKKNCTADSELSDFLSETDVGITEYTSVDLPGFFAIFKQRYANQVCSIAVAFVPDMYLAQIFRLSCE